MRVPSPAGCKSSYAPTLGGRLDTLRSYLNGEWVHGTGPGTRLTDPTTGVPYATVSSDGLDLHGALPWIFNRYSMDIY